MAERPLSPHLLIYRMGRYTLATSIFNRFTGVILAAGQLLLVYWLMAVASGSRAYLRAHEILSLPIMRLLYVALAVSFCYHLVAGVRHLVWDTGRGLERAQAKRSAAIVVVLSALLILAFVYCMFAGASAK